MATPAGIAAAARQAATGFALRAPPSAPCRAPVDLHHFLGHQRKLGYQDSLWAEAQAKKAAGAKAFGPPATVKMIRDILA